MKLATYASNDKKTLGRLYKESYDNNRSAYQRDRDRIIHSVAFRRLEYKTQVFVNHVGDHYRTRLTHSLEVSQVARVISRELQLDEDLAESIALAHDLGHQPFGHAGEDGLKEAAKNYGGFDHNAQAIKILIYLEQRYAEFDGLNLTWEALEGVAKHNGPLKTHDKIRLEQIFAERAKGLELRLDTFASLEAQVASLADDIAYCNHDIDDGIRAGFFEISDLQEVEKVGNIFMDVKKLYPDVSKARLVNEGIRRLMKYMVNDLINESKKRIIEMNITDPESVRIQKEAVIAFSPEVERMKKQLKEFLFARVYRHYLVNRMTTKAKLVVKELFEKLMESPGCLPTEWYHKVRGRDEQEKAEIIIDYIAGMTDRYAIEEYKKLFDPGYNISFL